MTRLLLVALLAGSGAASAQPGYYPPPGARDGPPCGQPSALPPRPRNTMPSYHEERMAPPPPGGGYSDSYGTADVEADQRGASAPPRPPHGRAGRRDPAYARAHYAARIAHWRARAAACEAGDLAACGAQAE